jgi:hypothetical protein
MADDTNDSGLVSRVADWQSTRRSFVAGVGSAAGLGGFAGTGAAQMGGGPGRPGAVYYVYRENGQYRVTDGTGVSFRTVADGNAEAAFQYAFDAVPASGGTVVAAADTFRFGGPATLGDDTALTGQRGTRFVGSQVGRRADPLPSDDQENPLARGHDLIRVRGDNAAVTNVEFDGAGTQLDSHAVQADDCTGVLIANNRTVNGFQMALSFTGCENVVVRGNEVVNPNWYGITSRGAPEGGERDLKRSTDVVVAENRVSGMKFNNIATYNVSNFSVVGNVVFDGGHSLIACSPAQQGTIVGNVCRDLNKFGGDPGGEAGIEIEYKETHLSEAVAGTPEATSYDITVTGNQIENCEVGFIARTVPAEGGDTAARTERRPYSFTVTGNAINDCEAAGIRVRSGAAGVVATNTIRNAGTAIDVDEEFAADIQRGLNVTRD